MSWRFHEEVWGPLTVTVLPRSIRSGSRCVVTDSNTGIVTKAPDHKAIIAQVVVNDGKACNADEAAINYMVTGDRSKSWKSIAGHAYVVPEYTVTKEDRADKHWVEMLERANAAERDRIDGNLESILGWCTDSVSCAECGLCLPGHFVPHVVEQAVRYGWGLRDDKKPVCPAHSTIVYPFPSLAEIES